MGISYYISMDINVFDDKIKKSFTVKVISDERIMEDMILAVLSPLFTIGDKGESLTVICCKDTVPECDGPCIYVGKGPDALAEGSVCLPRPLDIEVFIGYALSLCKKSTEKTEGWEYQPEAHTVSLNGKTVTLTKKEEELFLLLLSNLDGTVTRKEIENALWEKRDVGNAADVYVCHLKKKLEGLAGAGCLLNVRGKGYMLKRP